MGSNVDFKEIADFQARAKAELSGAGRDRFMESCTKNLAQEVMKRTVERTVIGKYYKFKTVTAKRNSKHHKKGDKYVKRIKYKDGGTLRKGWKIENPRGRGAEFTLDVANHVEYAPYVEYGHRTKGGKGWVRGRYMLTKSLLNVAGVTEKYLTTELEKVLRRIEKDGK